MSERVSEYTRIIPVFASTPIDVSCISKEMLKKQKSFLGLKKSSMSDSASSTSGSSAPVTAGGGGGSTATGAGVVERASKEISRRIHSLGFSKSSNSAKAKATTEEQQADKLNGNNENTR